MDCVRELHKYTDVKELSTYPWLFTKRQMGDLDGLGLWKYVATSACFFKAFRFEAHRPTARFTAPTGSGHLSEAWFGYGNTHQVLVDAWALGLWMESLHGGKPNPLDQAKQKSVHLSYIHVKNN
eukprot:g2918.t1